MFLSLGHWYCKNCCNSKGSNNCSQLNNGITERKAVYSSEDSSQSEDNETEVAPKVEKRFKLVLETEPNSDNEPEVPFDALVDQLNNREVSEDSDQNSKDCVSDNNHISNGIEGNKKEESVGEEVNNNEIQRYCSLPLKIKFHIFSINLKSKQC